MAVSVSLAAGIAAGVLALAGCAKMYAALGQEYLQVQFAPNTSLTAARHVTAACSHIPNVRLQPVRATTAQLNVAYSATYVVTYASDANLAQLQVCLDRFPSVQGLTETDPGDS